MSGIQPGDHYILDAIMAGAETVEMMLVMLNGTMEERLATRIEHEEPISRESVVMSLSRLILDNSVRATVQGADGEAVELDERKLPDGNYEAAVFDVTPRGSVRYSNWDPYADD